MATIRTAADHAAALQEIETLMTAPFGTPEGDKLDILVTLVEAYESKHFSDGAARPDSGDSISNGASRLGN